MLPKIRNYLEEIRSHLHLDPLTEKRVIGELNTYFQEKMAELQEQGISERDATREAIRSFGRARVVARLTYEAYSRGSWTEAALSSLPHLIIAGLFFSHLWHHAIIAPIAFALIVGVTLFGWWHGKPNWLYSWIGYSWFPLVIGGFASRPVLEQMVSFLFWRQGTFPSIWLLLLTGALFSFSLWIIIRTTIRVVRRDWILASLMLVPLPILGIWLLNIERMGGLFQGKEAVLYQWDASMALVLTVLALASAAFIRFRQRVLKAGALFTLSVIAVTTVGHTLWGHLGLLGLLLTSLLYLMFLVGPAVLEARIGHGEQKGAIWWQGVEHPSATTR